MTNCLISICIPAYEKPSQLQRLLQSICLQHFTSFEVVITDDSKTNAVEDIAATFTNRLPLRYYRNTTSKGVGNNWNSCVEKASAPWIKMMHDDDWFLSPHALGKFAAVAEQGVADFIFCGACFVDASNKSRIDSNIGAAKNNLLLESPFSLLYFNAVGHPSVTMFKKNTALVFDNQFRWVIDIDFYIRYLQQNDNYFFYIEEPLVNITNDDNQISAGCYKNPFVEIPEYLRLLSKFFPDLQIQNKYAFYCLWELVRRFSIKQPGDLKTYAYNGAVPENFEAIISYQKKIPRIILKQTPWNRWLMKVFFKTYKF